MATRKRKTPPEAESPAAEPADLALGLWNGLYRHQMQRMLQVSVALLRHAEEIGTAQLDAARGGLERHQGLLGQLQEAHSPEQLLALNAELWRLDGTGLMRWTRDMLDAGWRLQAEMLRCETEALAANQFETASKALQAIGNSLHTGLPPFDDLLLAPAALVAGAVEAEAPITRH